MKDTDYFPRISERLRALVADWLREDGYFTPNVLVFFGALDRFDYFVLELLAPRFAALDGNCSALGRALAESAVEIAGGRECASLGPPRVAALVSMTGRAGADGPEFASVILASVVGSEHEAYLAPLARESSERWKLAGGFEAFKVKPTVDEGVLSPIVEALRPLRRAADN